jgi:hypothetical protein
MSAADLAARLEGLQGLADRLTADNEAARLTVVAASAAVRAGKGPVQGLAQAQVTYDASSRLLRDCADDLTGVRAEYEEVRLRRLNLSRLDSLRPLDLSGANRIGIAHMMLRDEKFPRFGFQVLSRLGIVQAGFGPKGGESETPCVTSVRKLSRPRYTRQRYSSLPSSPRFAVLSLKRSLARVTTQLKSLNAS